MLPYAATANFFTPSGPAVSSGHDEFGLLVSNHLETLLSLHVIGFDPQCTGKMGCSLLEVAPSSQGQSPVVLSWGKLWLDPKCFGKMAISDR